MEPPGWPEYLIFRKKLEIWSIFFFFLMSNRLNFKSGNQSQKANPTRYNTAVYMPTGELLVCDNFI